MLESTDMLSVEEVLDVGSSTKKFRTKIQPYIDENIFKPLRERDLHIYHLDKKEQEGVDYIFDVNEMSVESLGKTFDLVICCSLQKEHVVISAPLFKKSWKNI